MEIKSAVFRYEYIYFLMGIEPSEIVQSRHWSVVPLLSVISVLLLNEHRHDMTLEELIMRHELLMKIGKYLAPDPDDPQRSVVNFTL